MGARYRDGADERVDAAVDGVPALPATWSHVASPRTMPRAISPSPRASEPWPSNADAARRPTECAGARLASRERAASRCMGRSLRRHSGHNRISSPTSNRLSVGPLPPRFGGREGLETDGQARTPKRRRAAQAAWRVSPAGTTAKAGSLAWRARKISADCASSKVTASVRSPSEARARGTARSARAPRPRTRRGVRGRAHIRRYDATRA